MRPEDRIRVLHMRDACLSILRFIQDKERRDLDQDEMLRFALVRAVEIIGEAAGRVFAETRQAAAFARRLVGAWLSEGLTPHAAPSAASSPHAR